MRKSSSELSEKSLSVVALSGQFSRDAISDQSDQRTRLIRSSTDDTLKMTFAQVVETSVTTPADGGVLSSAPCSAAPYSGLEAKTSYPFTDLLVFRNIISVAFSCFYGNLYPILDQNSLPP